MKNSKQNPLLEKSFDYAVHVVNETKSLKRKDLDKSIVSQFIRCGTSIGANVEEAIGGSSKRDFKNKLTISYKETRESNYWVRLLSATDYIDSKEFKLLFNLNSELQKILYSSIRSASQNINESKSYH